MVVSPRLSEESSHVDGFGFICPGAMSSSEI